MTNQTIGWLHGGALGDFVLSWQLLHRIQSDASLWSRRMWARSPMADANAEMWRLDGLDNIETCRLHTLYSNELHPPAALAQRLRTCRILVSTISDEEDVFARRLREVTDGRLVCLDPRSAPDSHEHILEQWAGRLRGRSLSVAELQPTTLSLSRDGVAEAQVRLRKTGGHPNRATVIVHPGSGGKSKCWKLGNFLETASRLRNRGHAVVFLTGPVERERLSENDRAAINKWPKMECPSLTDLALVLAGADFVLCNDSGVAHLAAATGARVITIFGRTDPRVWRPFGPNVHTLGEPGAWPRVSEVLQAAERILA